MTQAAPPIRREMQSRGYIGTCVEQDRRQRAIHRALFLQRYAFSHAITTTFPTVVTEVEVVKAINRGLMALGGQNGKKVHYFYDISLDREYWYASSVVNALGDVELLTQWHVHLLIGGLTDEITCPQIEHAFKRFTRGNTCVQKYDHDPKLCAYLSDSTRGNLVGRLQGTNDRTIKNSLGKVGESI